jgi:hypothetical protein
MCTPRESKRCLGAVGGIPAYGFLLAEEMTEHDGRGERDMNLKSGELYFINEVDVLTGVASNFYKIGLVKDSRQGDAANRLDEHQTGNPRKLVIVECIEAPAISDLEKSVHKRFATSRILGEWFVLNEEELAAVIAVARNLSMEQSAHSDRLKLAAELAKTESTDEICEPNEESFEWFRRARVAKELEKRTKVLKQQSDSYFKAMIEKGLDTGLVAGWTTSAKTSFDKEKFAESHPALFDEFQKEETKLAHRFLLKSNVDAVVLELDDSFIEFEGRLSDFYDNVADNSDFLEEVHLVHLELLGFQAQAKWDFEIAEANLKALCGTASAIDGIATWGRKFATTTKLDEAALKRDRPDVYMNFAQEVSTQSFGVSPMRSYAISGN